MGEDMEIEEEEAELIREWKEKAGYDPKIKSERGGI